MEMIADMRWAPRRYDFNDEGVNPYGETKEDVIELDEEDFYVGDADCQPAGYLDGGAIS